MKQFVELSGDTDARPWSLRLRGVGISHIGKKRFTNQDRFHVNNEDQIYAVADGVGGMRYGERASDIAIHSLRKSLQFDPHMGMSKLMSDMHHAVRITGTQLTGSGAGLGTTVTCVRRSNSCCELGHIGDSKLFLIREGSISQLSVDHSVEYTPKQASVVGAGSVVNNTTYNRTYLSRYLGQNGTLNPLVLCFRPVAGDQLLLCSDGISGYIADSEILAIIEASKNQPNAIQSLIAAAECRGGADNQTAVLVECVSGQE